MNKIINVILSGGVGSRLWPLSRKSKPKQYLNIFEGKSLFAHTVDRNATQVDEVILVGSVENIELSRIHLNGVQAKEIVETTPRNTAAAIAFAAFASQAQDILIVTPSDHLILDQSAYEAAILEGIALAKENVIVTFGIKPDHPETGYGYIESMGIDVKSFREKPNLQTAKEFLKQGNFLWNSGIFCFKAGLYLEELNKYEPVLYQNAKLAFEAAQEGVIPEALSFAIPSKSIDYAVMERSDLIKVITSDFAWSDMGSFDALYKYYVQQGYPVDEDGNMVISEDRNKKYYIFCGVKNAIIVNTADAMLILDRQHAQDVKGIYEELEQYKSTLI